MASLFKIVCGLIRDLTGLYRPERHYMRGPGPAWRAKHPEASPKLASRTSQRSSASSASRH
jgi:hypothetical protein